MRFATLGTQTGCMSESSCFICLGNRLFGEALNVASLHLYVDHINSNKASNISLMFTAAKSHFSLYLCYCLYLKTSFRPQSIIDALTWYISWILLLISKRGSMNYLCHYFCC